ncbi:unnamed protein product, partial [marine sediment metagenome]
MSHTSVELPHSSLDRHDTKLCSGYLCRRNASPANGEIAPGYGGNNRTNEESYKIAQRDIENIKKLGFNAVRYWVDWLTVEPEPGIWNLDFIDRLM